MTKDPKDPKDTPNLLDLNSLRDSIEIDDEAVTKPKAKQAELRDNVSGELDDIDGEDSLPPWELNESMTDFGPGFDESLDEGLEDSEVEADTVITGKTSRVHVDLFGGSDSLFSEDDRGLWLKKISTVFRNRRQRAFILIGLGILLFGFGIFYFRGDKERPNTTVVAEPPSLQPLQQDPVALSVAKLRILSNPKGATIFLNGEQLSGITPLEISNLGVEKTHSLTIQKQGFETIESTIKLKPDETKRLHFDLFPIGFHLRARSKPIGAWVFMDGKKIGKTPLDRFVNPKSKHVRLTVKEEGYQPFSKTVKVGNQLVELDAVLKPAAPNKAKKSKKTRFGSLQLDSVPVAIVYLNGKRLNQATPISNLKVPIGDHTLKFLNPQSGKSQIRKIRVRRGERVQVRVNLR